MSPTTAIEELVKLTSSRGWQIVDEQMRAEIVEAAMQIATNVALSREETDFRRGAIWAAKQLIDVPQKLISKFENDIALATLDDKTKRPPLL